MRENEKMIIVNEVIKWLSRLLLLVIPVLIGIFVYRKNQQEDEEKVLKARQELLKEVTPKKGLAGFYKGNYLRHYNKTQVYLSQVGANYLMKRIVDPTEYILAKLILASIFGFCGFVFFGWVGLLVGIVFGYMILKIMLEINNKEDNERMLEDFVSIYETIMIKTEAGIFLTDALKTCYKSVENKRLKKELYYLMMEITAQNNVTEALSKFQLKFKDIHINELCSVIRQGYETGNVVNAIANVTKHLNDIQKAVELRNNQKLDNNITKVQMVILLSIMVIVIYGIITSMSSFNIF